MTSAADEIRIEVKHGADLLTAIGASARLRITIFRDRPYLYDGDAAYEECYLVPVRTACVRPWRFFWERALAVSPR